MVGVVSLEDSEAPVTAHKPEAPSRKRARTKAATDEEGQPPAEAGAKKPARRKSRKKAE
jgi:hypothetical protein